MNEQTAQIQARAVTLTDRISLDDLVEAVTRGVTQALAAQDDVSGYASFGAIGMPIVLTTIVYCPPPPPPSGPRAPRGSVFAQDG
ncbi:MAG: hypothetical protein ACRDJ9_03330 [Dehalococcoidia bacterium]